MRLIRGRLLKSMEEDVVVRRQNPQLRSGEDEFLYPVGASPVKAVILPFSGDATLGNMIQTEYGYRCNFVPPREEIRIGDEIVRTVMPEQDILGKTHNVLTVRQVTIVQGVQQLILEGKTQQIV